MSLILSIGSKTVRLPEFLDTNFPRVVAEFSQPKVDYSIAGASALYAPACPNKHIWTVNAVCTPEIRRAMKAIAAEFDFRQKPQNGYPNADILIYDYTDSVIERTPRTRAIAPNSTESPYGNDQIEYFAQFHAVFITLPKFTRLGSRDSVNFTLTETAPTSP